MIMTEAKHTPGLWKATVDAEFRRMKALQGDYNFCPWLVSPAELDELQELKKQFKDYLQ